MGLTQSKLAVRDFIFDARLCGPEGGAVVVLPHGWPEFSSWWRNQTLNCLIPSSNLRGNCTRQGMRSTSSRVTF